MAKKRTINEIRQTKEYYTGNWQPEDGDRETKPSPCTNHDKECELDPVEEAKTLIVDKITKHLSDVIFEKVCNEMGNHSIFQSQNYLTEAGYEMFEDEWFEFYHEHHGDILYEVMQNITN